MDKVKNDIKMLSSAVKRVFEDRVLSRLYEYGDSYLMVLEAEKNSENESYDPFYLVNKETYDLTQFAPVTDLKKFKAVVAKEPLYDRSKEE